MRKYKDRIMFGILLFLVGYYFNAILYFRNPLFQEWLLGKYCIGDIFYVTGISLWLSVLYEKLYKKDMKNFSKDLILLGLLFWCLGYCSNCFLFPRYRLFNDIIYFDNGVYSIGDIFLFTGYSTILSIVWRGGEINEKQRCNVVQKA